MKSASAIAACTTSKHCLSQKRRENPYGWCVNPTNFQMYISYGILNKNPVCSVDRYDLEQIAEHLLVYCKHNNIEEA